MIRLFVALKIPSEIKRNLLHYCKNLVDQKINLRWESHDKIHLTLKFIGEVDEVIKDEIRENLSFINEYHPFEFRITKFDFFYRDNEPKILWVGLETDERIYKLVYDLNQTLSRFSVPVENRKFKPHLTLLRLKRNPGIEFVKNFREFSLNKMNFISNEAALIKSELIKSGAVYTEIQKYNLK